MLFGETERIMSRGLLFVVFLLALHEGQCQKIRYTTDTLCDRHSLDAVYHEKHKLITNNIFADIKEFINRVADLFADSLSIIMADLPDRDFSDNEERLVHTQFKVLKRTFSSKVRKIQKNITISWEQLIVSHFDLMFDNGKTSLEDYQNKTVRMTDSYSDARKALDVLLSSFVGFVKATVRDGLVGIKVSSEKTIKADEEDRKNNGTEEDPSDAKKKNPEELLQDKMVEIAKMIVPGFLGKVTIEVIQRKMDLAKENGVKPENRDSVLDDIEFDMLMVKNRVRAIIQTDIPRDKGARDLARRSIYTYWADQADIMYKDKIKSKQSPNHSDTGRIYYRNMWKDEDQIVETLLNLMEVYP